jgi:hypothetical protein
MKDFPQICVYFLQMERGFGSAQPPVGTKMEQKIFDFLTFVRFLCRNI